MPTTDSTLDWVTANRFGLFVHWGPYAIPARHEWMMMREEVDPADYEKYARYFDPDRYDPADWVRRAKAAGMRYAVITTKHHDGFCMWDTATTDYKITNAPYGRDALREFVDACRDGGLGVGLYYSLLDWHHPQFPVDALHPLRNRPDVEELNTTRDIAAYRAYMHAQVEELVTQFGDVEILFFDYSYSGREAEGIWGGKGPVDWGSEELVAMVRKHQPGIVLNDRAGVGGDFVTPEEYQPSAPMQKDGQDFPWIGCQTLDGSWGYYRDHLRPKDAETVIKLLIDGVSKNGSLLLNIGPNARGALGGHADQVLAEVGDWFTEFGVSIDGAGATSLPAPQDTRYTLRGNRLFLHLFSWPYNNIHLAGLAGHVELVRLVSDGSEIGTVVLKEGLAAVHTKQGGQPEGTLTLKLPIEHPEGIVPVIELILDEEFARTIIY